MEQQPPQMEKVSETDASSSTEVGTALGLSHHSSYTAVSPMAAPQQSLTPPPPQPQQQQPPPPLIEVNRMMQLLNDHNHNLKQQHQVVGGGHGVINTSMPSSVNTSIFMGNSTSATGGLGLVHHQPSMEEIHRLVEYQQACINHHFQQQQQQQPQPAPQQQQQQQQQLQFQFEALNSSSNPSSTGSSTNNMPFLFSNYLFSPAQTTVVNNPLTPQTASSSTSLQLPPVTVASAAAGLAFSDRSLWDWNPYSEPNRDHFSNLFK